jgi:hypothetical protein
LLIDAYERSTHHGLHFSTGYEPNTLSVLERLQTSKAILCGSQDAKEEGAKIRVSVTATGE